MPQTRPSLNVRWAAAMTGPTGEHVREATTPLDDGTLLADCSCGETYTAAQGGRPGEEYEALEAARNRHVDSFNARFARGEL